MLTQDITNDLICENLSISDNDTLNFAGLDTASLAKEYGTPLYLMDENRIRKNCRSYLSSVHDAFGEKGKVLYASKAASFKRIYEIMKDEGMGIDVVSSGEIATAVRAGFHMKNAFFHSNNKTDSDIEYAIENGVGYFVADNEEELFAINRISGEKNVRANVLLRVTPGIDPHTYEEVATGKIDSKFGAPIELGQAEALTRTALSLSNLCMVGFHCHVGSQVFDSFVYEATADIMVRFISDMRGKLGFVTEILDIGGGFGVRYVPSDPILDIAAEIKKVGDRLKSKISEYGLEMPVICFEPGRSIVADAGLTLYTVGSVKKIPGYKNYISVDGGMTDNPRFALYGSKYTVLPAEQLSAKRDMICSVVGRCCESGDIIQENVNMPSDMKRGDIVACLTTGAYNYSMASNYNRLPRPPIVMLCDGKSYIAVRRETPDDITALDI